MASVVQCTNCGKKLKLKTPSPGKQLRCPGCKEPFVPGGAAKKRKKKAAPVDDYDDFGDEGYDDDGYEEAAQPRRSGGGKKKKKAPAPARRSKAPLFIGIGVLSLALVGGLVFFLLPGGDADSDTVGTPPPSGDGGVKESMEADAGTQPQAVAAADSSAAASAAAASSGRPSEPLPPEFRWMPADGELVVQINVANLLAGPVGKLLENPAISAMVAGIEPTVGVSLRDVERMTVAVSGISQAGQAQLPPSPDDINAAAVVHTRADLDLSKLALVIPGAQQMTADTSDYLKLPPQQPGDPAMAAWVADGQTLVIGRESEVAAQMKRQETAMKFSAALLDADATLNIAFQPNDPDQFFTEPDVDEDEDELPAAKQRLVNLLKVLAAHGRGVAVSADIGDSVTFSGNLLAANQAGAAEAAKAVQTFLMDLASDNPLSGDGPVPAVMQIAMSQFGRDRLNEIQVTSTGSLAQLKYVSAEAGQQLNAMIPTLPMMVMGALGGGMDSMKGDSGMMMTDDKMMKSEPDHLRNIALAMHNFHQYYRRFPNAASRDEQGNKLLSWRVHVLPFIGYEDLHEQFALDEPWDSPRNRPLVNQIPEIYQSADADIEFGRTRIQAVTGRKTAFEDQTGRSLADFSDGTSNTVMLVEVAPDRAVFWTEPEDYKFVSYQPTEGLAGEGETFRVALADGTVRTLSPSASPLELAAVFSRNSSDSTGELLLETNPDVQP